MTSGGVEARRTQVAAGAFGRLALLAMMLSACVSNVNPKAESPSSISRPSTPSRSPTVSPSPSTTAGPTRKPDPGRPKVWFGARVSDLAQVAEDGTVSVLTTPPDGFTFSGVQLGGEALLLNLCCEPADGRYAIFDRATGALDVPAQFGFASGVDEEGRWLRVQSNGQQMIIEALSGGAPTTITSEPGLLPGYASLAPDGSLVAVAVEGLGESFLYAFDPRTTSVIEEGALLAGGSDPGPSPDWPAIDAYGRVWYVEELRPSGHARTGRVIDPATGQIETIEYEKDVRGQNFDPSGLYLIITYSDGSVGWRSVSGETGWLADTGYQSADW